MYATNRRTDPKLTVLKRRRTPELSENDTENEPLSDVERGESTPISEMGGVCTSIKVPSTTSMGLSDESDSESDDGRLASIPETVSLRQSVDPEDIERAKEQNNRGMHELDNVLEDDDSIEEASKDLDSPVRVRQNCPTRTDHQSLKSELRKNYIKKYNLPPVLYLADLIRKIQPFLPVVEDMYKHKVHSPYKYEATAASEASNSAVLSLSEFRSMDINRFVAGYYGLKRQLSVGDEILRHFKEFLLNRQGKTMNWWGVSDFANYVLAPEVLASLCISEMNLGNDLYDPDTREKAYDIFHSTVEFGLVVADSDPLERWEAQFEHDQEQKPQP